MEWYYILLIVVASIVLLTFLMLEIFYLHGFFAMKKKGQAAQICYEDLKKRTGINLPTKVEFLVNKKRARQMLKACFKDNPFPRYRIVLMYLRLKAVVRLYKREDVLQTVPGCAVGTVKYPTPATYVPYFENLTQNMKFTDGNTGCLNKFQRSNLC